MISALRSRPALVDSSLPNSTCSRSRSMPVIQTSNSLVMARSGPPAPQPKSRIDIELLIANGFTSSRAKGAPPGPRNPSPQIAWRTRMAGFSHGSSLIGGGGGSGSRSSRTCRPGGGDSDGGRSTPSHQARKRCLNGALGAPSDGFRFSSAMAFSTCVRPFGRPRSQACQRSFNTENVVVNKPSNASYHRLNTHEKRNFHAGRSNGDPGPARLPRHG